MFIPRNSRRLRTAALSVLATGALVGGLVSAVPASAAPDDAPSLKPVQGSPFEAGRYIVVLQKPAATQFGGGGGFDRTRAREDGQFDSQSRAVQEYTAQLRTTHRRIAAEVGTDIEQDYTMSLNGFAADLTSEQASALAADRRVLTLAPEAIVKMQTWNTPEFLGMTGKKGVWRQHGGKKSAGDGVVVGVLDTGIWPESESFAGEELTSTSQGKWDARRVGEATFMDKRDGTRFTGACEVGEEWELSDCSTKIIGARYYDSYFDSIPEDVETDFRSPRDGGGHGSHTAGTAAGNSGVRAKVEDRNFGRISGMAPAAAIAVYKVLWESSDDDYDGGSTVDIVAAIDDAVADGVDIINYSIGGGVEPNAAEPTLMAFEGAAEAGIFTATSASNAGPDAETVEKAVPWMTSVAAATHTNFENTVVLGNGRKFVGASISSTAVPSSPLVDSASAAPDGATEAEVDDAALCGPETLDDGKVEGAIVVCTRGEYDRVAKSEEVARAGGVGMILANPTPNSLDADFHSVPTVHVDEVAAEKIWDYIDTYSEEAPTAAIKLGNLTKKQTPVPQVAGFSGRGPASMVEGDMIKPDIAAPGVSVLAAVAPPSNSDRDFDLYSGTSMASPHIAGLAAFMVGERPRMTAMKVKSAMMTTAKDLFGPDGELLADPFAQGAGHVVPKRMFNPGLYVVSDKADWLGFLTGQGFDTGIRAIEAKDVNQPSMAEGEAAGPVTFTRELTAGMAGRWKVDVDVPGFSVDHTRKIVTDRKGDVEDLEVTFQRTTATFGEYSTGFVTLTGPTTVRIPVAIQPVSVAAPSEVSGTGINGEVEVPITAAAPGGLTIDVAGLAEANTAEDDVEVGDYDLYLLCGADAVSETSKVLRVGVDSLQDDADLDLSVYQVNESCDGLVAEAGYSATGSADEQVTLLDPEPGNYAVFVDGYADGADGDGAVTYVMDVFDVDDDTNLGSFQADPNPVPVSEAGQETSFLATWTGLEPNNRYLGVLAYEGSKSPTLVSVDTAVE